jgi:hypothetical protein
MARLLPHLPFVSDETPASWAARLAAFHTGTGLSSFLADMRIPILDLATGKHSAILKLCEMADQDPEPVLANTITGLSRRRHGLRGMTVCAEFLSGRFTKFCPLCLLEDGEIAGRPGSGWRHRLEWRFASVRTCSVHGLQLAEKRSPLWPNQIPDLQEVILSQGLDLRGLADTLPRRAVSPMQLYVVDRLEGRAGPKWLDDQGIDQAVRACEMFGGLLAFGPSQKAADLDMAGWDAAGAAGWAVAAQGSAAIRSELIKARSRLREDAPHAKFAAVYGMLYAWLTNTRMSKDPGPIRDLLRDVIVEHVPLQEGQKLLGAMVDEPHLATIFRVAQRRKVNPTTLTNFLAAQGLITQDQRTQSPGSVILDNAVAQSVVQLLKSSVSVHRAQGLLCISRPMMQILMELGLLRKLWDTDQHVSVKVMGLISGDIDRLLDWINDQFPVVEAEPPDYADLAEASQQCRVPLRSVIEGLRQGHLDAVRLAGEAGFKGIRVSLAKVMIEAAKASSLRNHDDREGAECRESDLKRCASTA